MVKALAAARAPDNARSSGCSCGGGCPKCRQAALRKVSDVVSSPGAPLEAARRDREVAHGANAGVGGAGHDFSRVRIHTGESAADAAALLGARAFTIGRHVVFGEGEWRPHAADGQRLLAHELAHVVQADGVNAAPTRVGEPDEPAERAAQAAANGRSISAPTSIDRGVVRRDLTRLLPLPMSGPAPTFCYALAAARTSWFAQRYLANPNLPQARRDPRAGDVAQRMYDAWGHCFIACCTTQQSGGAATWLLGRIAEYGHTAITLGLSHDSLRQDLANQDIGRRLGPDTDDCAEACLQAAFTNQLDLTLAGYPRGAPLTPPRQP